MDLKDNPPPFGVINFDDVKKLFSQGDKVNSYYYFSAIMLAHALIEAMLQIIFDWICLTKRANNVNTKFESKKLFEESLQTLGYRQLNQVLFDLGVINKETFQKLIQFNSFRNRVAHRLIKSQYWSRFFKPITEEETTEMFKDAKILYETLEKINLNFIKESESYEKK